MHHMPHDVNVNFPTLVRNGAALTLHHFMMNMQTDIIQCTPINRQDDELISPESVVLVDLLWLHVFLAQFFQ